MQIKIPNNMGEFFKANYDNARGKAYLCDYIPHEAIKNGYIGPDEWRYKTYSPEILNFKEGKEEDIRYFVKPIANLINKILSHKGIKNILIIPIPSSIPDNSKNYKNTPRLKGESRNRDNRNILFCSFLKSYNNKWETLNILRRIKEKKPKAKWNLNQQINSMELKREFVGLLKGFDAIFLFDDVATTGNTLNAAKNIIQNVVEKPIFLINIGQTKNTKHANI